MTKLLKGLKTMLHSLSYFNLIATGFIQVYFVAINTVLLASKNIAGVFIASFLISLIWSYNVKKIAFGSIKDRILYSFGAGLGGISGLKTILVLQNW